MQKARETVPNRYHRHELGETIRSQMMSLTEVKIDDCEMPLSVSAPVLKGISTCPWLQKLDLSGNTLTDCMVDLLGGDDYPGFPSLQELYLSDSKLSGSDVMNTGASLHSGKLSKITQIHLCYNKLTNCVRFLVYGPLSITYLCFDGMKLCGSDLVWLSAAIASNKLPKLEELSLDGNNMNSMEEYLMDLIVSYKYQYTWPLVISLRSINLSCEFQQKIEKFCLK